MLTETIRQNMLAAMKARRTLERSILKVALGELQGVEVRTGKALSDDEASAVLRKLVKSNHESMDLVKDEETRTRLVAETAILEALLPQTLGVDAIVTALAPVADQIRGAKADGPATGMAMKHLKGMGAQVEGKDVAAAVRTLRG